jgi:hypothetical protein
MMCELPTKKRLTWVNLGPISRKIYNNNTKNIGPPFSWDAPWNDIVKNNMTQNPYFNKAEIPTFTSPINVADMVSKLL